MLKQIPQTIHGLLLDMDGTLYIGNKILPGVIDFFTAQKSSNLPYLFLTNNSSKNSKFYSEKLQSMGIPATIDLVITSGQVAITALLKRYPKGKVALLGNQSLSGEFNDSGFVITYQNPDFAVLGFDDELTYEHFANFCSVLMQNNIPYYATHADIVCPSLAGFIPDAGSFIEAIFSVTGRRPDMVFGKPNLAILNMASSKLGIPIVNLAMIGDRLYTDIALKQHGIFSILTLSGETRRSDLQDSPWMPDLIIDNLRDLL